jgi:hypothetical protein
MSPGLPVLDEARLAALFSEREPRRVLLGIFAARALSAKNLVPLVAKLRNHPERVVREAAEGAVAALDGGRAAAARVDALSSLAALCDLARPILTALAGSDGPALETELRPRVEDFARVFVGDIAERVRAAYDVIWRGAPLIEPFENPRVEIHAAPAGMLGDDNELSRRFPGGYRALAPYLVRERIWFVWRYLSSGEAHGMRYDGSVRLDDRWVWFPKLYRVVGELLRR